LNVYFVKASRKGPMVKIGKAIDVGRRLAELQTGCPDPLVLLGSIKCRSEKHAMHIESVAHRRFKKYRAHGEWFHFAPELREFVQNLEAV
jgi:Meiotically up-regulated gene 113